MPEEKTWANLIQSLCGAYHWSSSERKPRPKSAPRSLFEIAGYRRTKPQAGVTLRNAKHPVNLAMALYRLAEKGPAVGDRSAHSNHLVSGVTLR